MEVEFFDKTELVIVDALATLKKEIAILKKMNHPNIIKLYEVINDMNNGKTYMGT